MPLSGKFVRIRLTISCCHISILLSLVLIVRDVCLCITISSCYGSVCLVLVLIGRNGGLGTLCHSCGFACRERMLKTFPGPEKWISTTTKNTTKISESDKFTLFHFQICTQTNKFWFRIKFQSFKAFSNCLCGTKCKVRKEKKECYELLFKWFPHRIISG